MTDLRVNADWPLDPRQGRINDLLDYKAAGCLPPEGQDELVRLTQERNTELGDYARRIYNDRGYDLPVTRDDILAPKPWRTSPQ